MEAIKYFNPRAPCGARPGGQKWRVPCCIISIHAPLAGRDAINATIIIKAAEFQSTRPLRGATQTGRSLRTGTPNFNPRAPCGARLIPCGNVRAFILFQSTRPLRGATAIRRRYQRRGDISIHAPLAGRDSKFDEFLSANLHKSNKRDLLSEEKMRHGLPRTTCMSHFRSFLGAKLQRFSARLPFALRS